MNRQDVEELKAKATASPDAEAYALAAKGEDSRVGACASASPAGSVRFGVEVLVQLCPAAGPVDLEVIERRLRALKELEDRGFELSYEGDGCVSCQKVVEERHLAQCVATEIGRLGLTP
jgi:hypothetical protein